MAVTSPTDEAYLDIELRLGHVDDLFVLPATDLMSEYRNYYTGMEYALSELKGSSLRRPVRLNILLPDDQITPGLSEQVQKAVGRYSEYRIRYNRREIKAMRRDGFGALPIGLAVLAFGLFLSEAVRRVAESPDYVKVFFSDGLFLVLAWVGLWYPLDVLAFATRPYQREIRALRALAECTVVVDSH